MNILITNDDGISAPGIALLAQAAVAFGNVTVVAPARQCSAMSHRITLGRELRLEARDLGIPGVRAYSLEGTPADCVKAALDAVMPQRPDVVLSGVNFGFNVGYDIAYSGTVGAAMEALMNGVSAIALSNDVGEFDIARQYLPSVLEKLLPQAPSKREIWNVNFPTGHCNGILFDRTVAPDGYYSSRMRLRQGEENVAWLQYPLDPDVDNSVPRGPEDSDLSAVIRGYVSVGRVGCSVMAGAAGRQGRQPIASL